MSPILIVLATCLLILLSPAILSPTRTLQTLRRKKYQYEVTFGLYMMTPTEKVIFNTIILTILSLFILGVVFYLPSHVSIIFQRAFYYWSGDFFSSTYSPLSSVTSGVTSITSAIQNSMSNANSEAFKSATQKVATSAQDLAKGLAAAAAGEAVRAFSQTPAPAPAPATSEEVLQHAHAASVAGSGQSPIVVDPASAR